MSFRSRTLIGSVTVDCQSWDELAQIVDCSKESFYPFLISWCRHVVNGTHLFIIRLDSFLCEFVTNVGDFFDFEDTRFFV